jgi:predicted pyridoxine 5'-phosphate oxidase superfamily flavin-nucleotide-binding protein
MTSLYHAAELALQARVGVQEEALRLSKGIFSVLKPAAQDFLPSQQMAIVSSIDANGRVWASLLTGAPGFIQAVAEQTVRIEATPVLDDPLSENLLACDEISVLVIDFATRRRLRLNGLSQVRPEGGIDVRTHQVYFNCPKYIQSRHLDADLTRLGAVPEIQRTDALTRLQQHWIAQTDTFFIASFYSQSGADASHRGGHPGFVRILSSNKLVFPDYSGNNMFNTLGNISINPLSGLLFIDFERGSTLQLTGRAYILWDADCTAQFAGAERLVEFQIDQALEITNATPLRWRFVAYSPFNPI